MNKAKKILLSQNFKVLYIIIAFSALVAVFEPSFVSTATLVNLERGALITLCFALSELLVMLTGGIDVSFPAIACVSMYVPSYLYNNGMLPNNGFLFVLVAVICGLLLGAINGVLVSYLKFPPLIATLATSAVAQGITPLAFGVKNYTNVPTLFETLYGANIFVYTDKSTGITYPLTSLILVPIILAIIIAVVLKFSMIGRGLYAMGGNLEAARIVGFPIKKLQFFTYLISGIIAAIGACLYVILMQQVTTTSLLGEEMLVIAACVVGGCSLSGGKGSVLGVVLGTILIVLVQNNLIMLGIDTKWQTLAVGVVLLIGVLMTSTDVFKKKEL